MNVREVCKNPYLIFKSLAARGYLKWLGDQTYIKFLFRSRMGKWPDLKAPKTFNEKLQWMKLYDRRPEYVTMVDKYAAKKYAADIIGQTYIIPTLGVWDRFEDIDFDGLPQQFVLKCTHDSGGLVICRDKENLDRRAAREKLQTALARNYYYASREWPYKDVKPRILAEQYMEDNTSAASDMPAGLTDYKFYCFDGEPAFLYISKGLEDHATARISFLTLDWKPAPFQRRDYAPFETLPAKPAGWDTMLQICRKLSKGYPFLRVDLYQIGSRVYFSELTLTPCSGMLPFETPEQDRQLGDLLHLPEAR